jgi:hypothetical protein
MKFDQQHNSSRSYLMSFERPSDIPSSFDPAVCLHSEPACLVKPPSESFSDDLRAYHQLKEEDLLDKNRRGIVIQHRSWKLPDVFLSEDDHPIGQDSSSKLSDAKSLLTAIHRLSDESTSAVRTAGRRFQ